MRKTSLSLFGQLESHFSVNLCTGLCTRAERVRPKMILKAWSLLGACSPLRKGYLLVQRVKVCLNYSITELIVFGYSLLNSLVAARVPFSMIDEALERECIVFF